jgi:hypothetical protein
MSDVGQRCKKKLMIFASITKHLPRGFSFPGDRHKIRGQNLSPEITFNIYIVDSPRARSIDYTAGGAIRTVDPREPRFKRHARERRQVRIKQTSGHREREVK